MVLLGKNIKRQKYFKEDTIHNSILLTLLKSLYPNFLRKFSVTSLKFFHKALQLLPYPQTFS